MRTAINTHGQALASAGQTAAGEVTLGTITLPAGGPWNIFALWAHCVAATLTPAEVTGGHIRLTGPSGDITPNPAPCKVPTGYGSSELGATAGVQCSPLTLHEIDLVAAGKSSIEIFGVNDVAVTVAPQWCAGILYGLEITESKIPHWYDQVNTGVSTLASTAVGTITLSEGATEIVSITAILGQGGVLTTAEELLGYFTLSSDDLQLPPLQIPVSAAFSAGLGATIPNLMYAQPVHVPTSIPVKGGARIDVACKLNTAITNTTRAKLIIGYR
jgi:hypothetical protein